MLRKYLFLYLFFLLPYLGYGQSNHIEYPINFSNYYENLTLITPAYFGPNPFTNFDLGYSGFTGVRRNNTEQYLSLDYHVKINKNYRSKYGLLFTRNQSGKYISRNHFYLSYAYQLLVNTNLKLSLGTQIGIYNFLISNNPSGIGGSQVAPDANIGIALEYNDFAITFSINQIFQAYVSPVQFTTVLKPYINIYGLYSFSLTRLNLKITPGIIYQRMNNIYDNWGINGRIVYRNRLGIGMSYQRKTGSDLLLKLYQNKIKNSAFDIGLGATLNNQITGSNRFFLQATFKPGFFSVQKN